MLPACTPESVGGASSKSNSSSPFAPSSSVASSTDARRALDRPLDPRARKTAVGALDLLSSSRHEHHWARGCNPGHARPIRNVGEEPVAERGVMSTPVRRPAVPNATPDEAEAEQPGVTGVTAS